MARGKYAARAANARANEAQQSAAQLTDLLAAERLDHARKVAELNGRIAQLQGRLDKEVGALADAEVQRVRDECQRQLEAERADWRSRSKAVVDTMAADPSMGLQGATWQQICALLDVPVGLTRNGRRATSKKLVAMATDHERMIDRAQRANDYRRRVTSLTSAEVYKLADELAAEEQAAASTAGGAD